MYSYIYLTSNTNLEIFKKVILASGNNHLSLGEWGRENKNKQQSPSFP
jgi:hypothetical protein